MIKSFKIFLIYILLLQGLPKAIVPIPQENGKPKDIALYENAGKKPIFASVGNMLITTTTEKNFRSCSGTLINKFGEFGVFLTARHCLKNNDIKTTSKCTNSSVSFDADPIWDGTKINSPIVAQIPFDRFGLEQSVPDLGIAIVRLKEEAKNTPTKGINFDVQLSEKSKLYVYVVGYGNTKLSDSPAENQTLTRRAMSQSATPIEMRSKSETKTRTSLITRGENMKDFATEIPWGYSASVGDSGGPMFDAATTSIIGTVQSGNFSEIETYYEFLPQYKDWFQKMNSFDSVKTLFYKSTKSGNWSDPKVWDQGKEPTLLQTPYVHAAPIIDTSSNSLEITTPTAAHQVIVGGTGGGLKVKDTYATFDVLSCDKGAVIDTSSGSIKTDTLEVKSGEISFSGGMLIGHQMSVGKGVSLDITENKTKKRNIQMKNNSILDVQGSLTAESLSMRDGSRLFLNGTVESHSGLTQVGGGLYVEGPSTIIGPYSLLANGKLIFNIKEEESVPMLTLISPSSKISTIDASKIVIHLEDAPRNKDFVLIHATEEGSLELKGARFSYRGVKDSESVKLSPLKNGVSVRVSSGVSSEQEEYPQLQGAAFTD